jgi:D-alanyl-D-alanine carboxypeptidase/D-alanyl-D-alanine-endopeptidase (penicillin-binding protein 4)
MKTVYLFISLLVSTISFGQNISIRLDAAIKKLQADDQFKHAIISMYVVDSKTGKPVFDVNSQIGLAPASCQKVVTSVSAYEMLGKDFRYRTLIGKDYSTGDLGKSDAGCLFIIGDGDPTFGSWRWKSTTDTVIFSKIVESLKRQKFTSFNENLVIEDYLYGFSPLPEGWIWQDIGNYYGAACFGFNWRENQYDMILNPGEKPGYPADVNTLKPFLHDVRIQNSIYTGKSGSGDNAYIYSSPFSNTIITKGTIPFQKEPFSISGSMPNPSNVFRNELMLFLTKNNITFRGQSYSAIESFMNNNPVHKATHIIDSIFSPSLDSMNYWFLKKSVNLYGEAFLKSFVKRKKGVDLGSNTYDTGIAIIKNFWEQRGIERSALKIIDGSGLSPANRVTTQALVSIMQYALQQDWFASFYYALPETNGIKMKDGYISGVRSYTGYIKTKKGEGYTFSFIVNNFDGSAGTVKEKMWKLLDILKAP